MKRHIILLFFLTVSGWASLPAYAANYEPVGIRPIAPNGLFSTFSANTLGEGKSGADISFEKIGEPHFYRISTSLAYGFSEGVELILTVPYFWDWQNTMGKNIDGVEDVSIAIKHRFFGEGRFGPSVAYILTASPLSGKSDVSTDGAYGAGIAISKRLGPVIGHANFIYSKPGNTEIEQSFPGGSEKKKLKEEVTVSAGFDFSAAHNFKILAEFYSRKDRYSEKFDDIELRFGYRFITSDTLFTTLGIGIDVNDSTPGYRVMLTSTWLYPEKKKDIKKVLEEIE